MVLPALLEKRALVNISLYHILMIGIWFKELEVS